MTKIEQIFWGWAKYSFMTLGWKPKPEQWHLAEQRLYICDDCPLRINNKCSKCGCNCNNNKKFLNKLAWADQECPIGKWGKVKPAPEKPKED